MYDAHNLKLSHRQVKFTQTSKIYKWKKAVRKKAVSTSTWSVVSKIFMDDNVCGFS